MVCVIVDDVTCGVVMMCDVCDGGDIDLGEEMRIGS